MNEVEPWSSRAGRALGAGGSGAARRLGRAWAWFTDLGQGAWMLAVAVAVVGALTLAIIHGRGGPEATGCGHGQAIVQQIDQTDGHRLTAAGADALHRDAAALSQLSESAVGEAHGALTYAAQMAGAAQAGQRFDAGFSAGKYQSACGVYP
jgi:hypothetical protein